MSAHISERLSTIFAGFSGAHNRFRPESRDKFGKISGRYMTVHSAAGLEQWEQHVEGVIGLGIVPLLDDGRTVTWAAIDVDDPTVDHALVARRADDLGIPIVVAKSKSGGAHCYVFFEQPEPADAVVDVLTVWIRRLGLTKTEIFPKQRRRADAGDIGNALNMPYFGGEAGDRCAIDPTGAKLTIAQFCDLASAKTTSLSNLPRIEERSTLFVDGPPCMQFIEANGGFAPGVRNNCMFNSAIYLLKRGDAECEGLSEINQQLCEDPLDEAELANIVRSAKRRHYEYTCKSPPISSFCNRSQCLARPFGVGPVAHRAGTNGSGRGDDGDNDDGDAMWPMVDEVTLHQSTDIGRERWYITTVGRRIRLRSEDVTSQSMLSRMFLAITGRRPPSIPKRRFEMYLDRVMFAHVNIVPPDEAESDFSRFKFHVDRFVGQRATTETVDGLKNGIPYLCDGITWFHLETLVNYLVSACPDLARRTEDIHGFLRDNTAARRTFVMSDGERIAAYGIKSPARQPTPPPPSFVHADDF